MAKKKRKTGAKKSVAKSKVDAPKATSAKPADDDKDPDPDADADEDDEPEPAKKAEAKAEKAKPAAEKADDDDDEDADEAPAPKAKPKAAPVDEDEDEDEDDEPAPKAAAKAAHHGHDHHAPDRGLYVKVWVYLAVLTMLEVGIAYLDKQLGKTALVTALVGLALAKAAAVAIYYMHLKQETKFMKYTVAFPIVFPALYAFILIAEGVYRSVWVDVW